MKKSLLLFLFIQVIFTVRAQQPIADLDNAILGTGLNQNNYVGSGWTHASNTTDPYLNNTCAFSKTVNDYVTIAFKGNKIEIFTRVAHHHGYAGVSIDNGDEKLVNMHPGNFPARSFTLVYISDILPEGNHVLKIRVTGQKHPYSADTYVVVDYVRIYSEALAQQSITKTGFEALLSNTSGYNNTAHGTQALQQNTTGFGNTAGGSFALKNNTVAEKNTAFGAEVLFTNSTGKLNSGVGYRALYFNTTGAFNTALGSETLYSNTSGNSNTAVGSLSLNKNTSGYENTALGYSVLSTNLDGSRNTGIGTEALSYNTNGFNNTAIGYQSLRENTSGAHNTALGVGTLSINKTGSRNVAIGLFSNGNQTGNDNTAVGTSALGASYSGSQNTGIGYMALYSNTAGSKNTALGAGAGPNSNLLDIQNSTAIGYSAALTASNQVRIGNSDVTSIGGQVSWSTLSDGRFKKDIKEDVSGLEFIKKLRPVSYTVDKDQLDKFLRVPDSIRAQNATSRKKLVRETGFVAQEVEALVKKTGFVFNGVEAPQSDNDHYSIRYAEFVVPLVKAVQELTVKLEDQDKKILTLVNQLEKHGLKPADGLSETSDEAELHQNNPNPFSVDTEIKVSLPETALNARVIIYNMEGKQLKNYPVQDRGNTSVKISGTELNAGMYLYALIVDGKVVDTKRMILTN